MLRVLQIVTVWLMFGGVVMAQVAVNDARPTPPVTPTPPLVPTPPVEPTPPVANKPAPPGRWVYQPDLTPAEKLGGVLFLCVFFGLPVILLVGEPIVHWHTRRFHPEAWNAKIAKRIEQYQRCIADAEAQKVAL